jgi:hypothetical protein
MYKGLPKRRPFSLYIAIQFDIIDLQIVLRNYLETVTLSEAKGLAYQKERFFAAFRMTLCVLR